MSIPQIRDATVDDVRSIATLLAQLGHAAEPDTVASCLARLESDGASRVLLAEDSGEPVGLIALHWFPLLHRATLLGRITALVVREDARGRGIGRLLTEHAAGIFLELGCGAIEVTSNVRRSDAHAFYRRMGFDSPSYYFRRPL